MNLPRPDTLVLFEVTGDLAHKMIFLTLYAPGNEAHLFDQGAN